MAAIMVQNIEVRGKKRLYRNDPVEGSLGGTRLIWKLFQNLNNLFANVKRAGELNTEYNQLDSRHWQSGIITCGSSIVTGLMARRYSCCCSVHNEDKRFLQQWTHSSSHFPSGRTRNWKFGTCVPNEDRAMSQCQTGCWLEKTLP